MTSVILLCLLANSPEPANIRALPGAHLTPEQAVEHAENACEASRATGEDLDILLAVAWHETRFTFDYVQREPGRRVSCGVLTPEPLPQCARRTHVDQYFDGARHLAFWRMHLGDAYLYGYAGGRGLYRACANGVQLRACRFPSEMRDLARRIGGRS
jgi:hypothetical protein